VSYLEWLRTAADRGLDIVAITDHNTVAGVAAIRHEIEWLIRLKQQGRLTEAESQTLAEWSELSNRVLVLPGFEFTATFGFHILGIFPPETSVRTLEYILLSLKVPAEKLDSGSTETGSTTDVLTAYRLIHEAGGLAIAAHANSTHGVAMRNFPFGGQTKIAYTQDPNLDALEVTDLENRAHSTARFFNGSKTEYPRRMHAIQGSDAHRLTMDPRNPKRLGIGERATEFLLDEPSFEALAAVIRSTQWDRTRPARSHERAPDPLAKVREEGNTAVQSFHDSALRQGGRMDAVLNDLCAFANSGGGTVYVGASLRRDGPRFLARPAQVEEQLVAAVETRIAPPIGIKVDTIPVESGGVLRLRVDSGEERPYAVDNVQIYVREGAASTLAHRDDIVAMVLGTGAPQEAPSTRTAASSAATPAGSRNTQESGNRSGSRRGSRGSGRGGQSHSDGTRSPAGAPQAERSNASPEAPQLPARSEPAVLAPIPPVVEPAAEPAAESAAASATATPAQATPAAPKSRSSRSRTSRSKAEPKTEPKTERVADRVAEELAAESPVQSPADGQSEIASEAALTPATESPAAAASQAAETPAAPPKKSTRKASTSSRSKKASAPAEETAPETAANVAETGDAQPPSKTATKTAAKPAAKRTTTKKTTKSSAAETPAAETPAAASPAPEAPTPEADVTPDAEAPAAKPAARSTRSRTTKSTAAAKSTGSTKSTAAAGAAADSEEPEAPPTKPRTRKSSAKPKADPASSTDSAPAAAPKASRSKAKAAAEPAAPPATTPAAASEPFYTPQIGVEIVATEMQGATRVHTIRDLRNGNTVRNVSRKGARDLWNYAITKFEDEPVNPDDLEWDGDTALVHVEKRAGKMRYDLALREGDAVRVFYGVTADGMEGRWSRYLGDE
jgi:hypothetical protein